MDRVELGVGWTVDNESLKKGMNNSKKSIEGVGQTIEAVEKKVNTSLNGMANHSLRANRSFNGLSNSINQISRELPAFTFSAQTGFLALSNNIPILFDELSRLRKENDALVLSGQKGIPVWKQVVSSLFSWQTALSLGVTLLTIYGPEIAKWVKELFNAKNAVDNLKKSEENMIEVRKNANKSYADASAKLQTYLSLASNEKNSLDVRQDALKKLIELDRERLKGITLETIKTGEATAAINKYNEALKRQAMEKAVVDKRAEISSRQLDAQFKVEESLKDATDAEIKRRNQKFKFDPDEETATDALAKRKIKEYQEARKNLTDLNNEAKLFDQTVNKLLGTSTGEDLKKSNKQDASYFRRIIESSEKELEGLDKLSKDFPKKSNELKQKIVAAQKELEAFSVSNDKIKDHSNFYDKTVDLREDALQKITDLDKEYARKTMQSDEAELQALKDKFQKARTILAQANKDIISRNAKNIGKKGYKPVQTFDISQLDPIEERASQQVLFDQETARIEKDIEKRKKLFSDYEEYKSKLGKEKADERFSGEMDGYASFLEYMQSLQEKHGETINAVQLRQGTEGQEKRAKLIEKFNLEAIDSENKKQVELLSLLITYDQKRKNLITEFEASRLKIIDSATDAELAEFDRKHNEELKILDDSNIQKLQAYKDLFSGIEDLSIASARKVINNAKLLLDESLSEDERRKILKALKDAENSLSDRIISQVARVADEFEGIVQSISQVNGELGNMLGLVSNVLRATVSVSAGIADLKKGIYDYSQNKKDGGGGILGTISGIAGIAGPVGQIVGAVTSVVSGVVDFFKASEESARLAAEEIKKYQESIITGELEYNRLLRERARLHGNINEKSLTELEQQKKLLELQLQQKQLREITYTNKPKNLIDLLAGTNKTKKNENLSDYEYALKRLQTEGREVTGQRVEKYGGFLGMGKKSRVVDITSSLVGKTYEDLEKLYTEGKMNESSKALFENLRKAKEEVDDINELMDQIDETIKDKMSGGITAASISSPIIQGLKEGKRFAKDFADYSSDVIQEALLSALNTTVLEEPLMEIVRKFREDAKDGLSKDEIAEFQKGYSEVVQQGIDAVKEIEKLTGKKIGGSNSSIASGRINQSITESTGSAILGFERARYDLAKRQLESVLQILDFDNKSYEQIIQSVRHLKAIEENTGNTVKELKNVLGVLESINKNTGNKGRTSEGMGL